MSARRGGAGQGWAGLGEERKRERERRERKGVSVGCFHNSVGFYFFINVFIYLYIFVPVLYDIIISGGFVYFSGSRIVVFLRCFVIVIVNGSFNSLVIFFFLLLSKYFLHFKARQKN